MSIQKKKSTYYIDRCGDTSVRYTHEQLRICNHNVAEGEILKIVAFAGKYKGKNHAVDLSWCLQYIEYNVLNFLIYAIFPVRECQNFRHEFILME